MRKTYGNLSATINEPGRIVGSIEAVGTPYTATTQVFRIYPIIIIIRKKRKAFKFVFTIESFFEITCL